MDSVVISQPLVPRTATPPELPARGGPTDPSHDEDLRRGILRTEISRSLAVGLVATFLLIIAAVPLLQAAGDLANGRSSPLKKLFEAVPTKAHLAELEKQLEDASFLRETVRPWLQLALSRYGGFGNSKTVIGRDGWLFYAPGVQAVAGPGFLDADTREARRRAARDAGERPVHPDPRPAIYEMHKALRARGIQLVLLSVPDKARIEAPLLHARAAPPFVPAGNPDDARLFAELRAAGIVVLDPTPARIAAGEAHRFLVQDTHWTPVWMEEVAATLARVVRQSDGPQRRWRTTPAPVSRHGDLVDMLRLPAGQTLFAPQAVLIRRVTDERGQPFRPNVQAPLLLLGDSFTNIYSLGSMGWGTEAGLAAHLAAAAGTDVDVIAQNDAGAHATRQLLARELERGVDRLAGKRVVIWQFAARELAVGDWRPVVWPTPDASPRQKRRFVVPPVQPVMVTAEVAEAAPVPRPGEVPYKDHIRALLLRTREGETLAYVQSMRDGVLTAAARWTQGTRVTVRLRAWSAVASQLDGINRAELDDEALLEAEPAWAETEENEQRRGP